jgi:hypothetical protein
MVHREAFALSLTIKNVKLKISFRIVCWQVKYLMVDERQR